MADRGCALQVLEHWEAGGHRALVFTQTQQMLDILEKSVQVCPFLPIERLGISSDFKV